VDRYQFFFVKSQDPGNLPSFSNHIPVYHRIRKASL